MIRDDLPTINETLDAIESADFLVILGGSKTYTLHWTNFIPTPLSIYSDGFERDKNVRFGVCLPMEAKFDLYTYSPKYLPDINHWTKASSLQELDSTKDGTKYYHDTNTGMLYLNFVHERVRHANETNACPGVCPMVTIKILQGNLNDGDCRSRLYHSRRSDNNRAITIPNDTQHFGATMKHPPSNWGAGPTKPFINRIPVNGGWGKWTNWGSCTLTCGGGQQGRTRACDAPRPAHGGLTCQGNTREQRPCNQLHCPVDGGFSQWSRWSTCIKSSGCQGYKKRTRTCTSPSPNYGGLYCHGSDDEVETCLVC
ncbi:cell surface hyaluronidase-like [Mercenaria mercenaria]|uniref:cell surface hyaluronidase-like n=1 Tax=Mercenaria mercenaria TaxID=6596 RepID=UPI00234E4F07|nr:cell surface hyaluronidase-like [Mercenaria mercenaria]